MQMTRRNWLRFLLGLMVILAIVVSAALWVLSLNDYMQERRAGTAQITELRQRCPADVDPETWEWATNWAITAYANVSFSQESTSLEEMRQFNADLAERFQ